MAADPAESFRYDHTLPGIDQRVTDIERERAAEAEARRANEAATKEDIDRLDGRFNALIKATWTIAGILATVGGSILANHL